eukprot:gene4954-9908_t
MKTVTTAKRQPRNSIGRDSTISSIITSTTPNGMASRPLASIEKITDNNTMQEELIKMQQDIDLLSRKLSDLTSNPGLHSSSGDGFVQGMRSTIDGDRRGSFSGSNGETKLHMLERIISRIVDLDRAVLRQTEPPNAEKFAIKTRASRGMDLNSIPTHLHIVDRLMDLYVQNRRNLLALTQIQNISPRSMAINGDHIVSSPKKNIDKDKERERDRDNMEQMRQKYETDILKLKFQLQEGDMRNKQTQEKLDKSVQELSALKSQISVKPPVSPLKSPQVPVPVKDTMELEHLRSQLVQAQGNCRSLEEHVEASTAREQAIVTELLAIAKCIRNEEIPVLPSGNRSQLPENVLGAIRSVGEATMHRLRDMQSSVRAAEQARAMVEREMSSVTLQRDIMGNDLSSLSAEHQALSGAYHALESESRAMETKMLTSSSDASGQEQLAKLQFELREALGKASAVPALEAVVRELQRKISDSDMSQISLHTEVRQLQSDNQVYRDLTESLKTKLKNLGSRDNREYLDTFEEVMRDEMMSMKTAFESKLKVAREEVETISKKHQMEIQRLQMKSPFTLATHPIKP